VIAIIYIAMCLLLSVGANRAERWSRRRGHTSAEIAHADPIDTRAGAA
jgi:glutamate transport system permease protein